MYETSILLSNRSGEPLLRVNVPDFSGRHLENAKKIALNSGYDPYRPGRMTEQGGAIKWFTFSKDGIKALFNGRLYYKIYAANDVNGNKVAKVFYIDGSEELIKDVRLPLQVDKFYKSISGLRKAR